MDETGTSKMDVLPPSSGAPAQAPDDGSARTVTVAVITYRRGHALGRSLLALCGQLDQVGPRAEILVVDNDPDGGARAVVQTVADRRIRYVLEREPGIAAARNRALQETPGDGLLVFIDDDETPCQDWLTQLLAHQARTGHAAVVGPVVSHFGTELDPWIAAGGFFERRRLATGSLITTAATNNLLLDLADVGRAGLRFDARFGMTGGSDYLFTQQLTGSGLTMSWCDDALVTDHVPAERMTRRWVLRRAMRYGTTASRAAIAQQRTRRARMAVRGRMTVLGLVRLAAGAGRAAAGVATSSMTHRARGRRTMMKGVGYVRGATGGQYVEYARS